MIGAIARGTFSLLAGSTLLKKAASRYGLRRKRGLARRFVAGETADEAIAVVRQLEARGLAATIDLLGESVTSSERAVAAARAYVSLIEAAAAAGVSRSLSVKLTQVGLAIDRATAIDNLRRIVDAGVEPGFFIRVDMEGSAWTEQTLDTVETLWSIGYRNVGVAIQAALKRSRADVERLNALGMSIRLVKGAYHEPRSVAFTREEDVEREFAALMETLLTSGHQPAIATHDVALIERAVGPSLLMDQAAVRVECRGQTVTLTALGEDGRNILDHLGHGGGEPERAGDRLTLTFPRIAGHDSEARLTAPSPFDVLRALSSGLASLSPEEPFAIALPGIVAYDHVDLFEELPAPSEDRLGFPDFIFWLAQSLIVFEPGARPRAICTAFGAADSAAAECAYYGAADRLARLVARCAAAAEPEPLFLSEHPPASAEPDLSDEDYGRVVSDMKAHIAAGDVYQIVPSRTFAAP